MSEHVRDEKVLEPYLYLGQILGKNVRGVLIDCQQKRRFPFDADFTSVIGDFHAFMERFAFMEDSERGRGGSDKREIGRAHV